MFSFAFITFLVFLVQNLYLYLTFNLSKLCFIGMILGKIRSITSLEAHWKPATTESLISFKYWTALVQSTSIFGPLVLGPNAQILRALLMSQSYLSAK